MPLLRIQTNITIEESAEQAMLTQLSATVADQLGKPEGYVMVMLEGGKAMFFAANDDPAAYLELKSLGLPQETTPALCAALCEVVNQQLSIPADRIYIEFSSPPRHMWGWNNSTFG